MAWKIELDVRAAKELSQLDNQQSKRILRFLRDRVAALDNPRAIGECLRGELGEFWKYRVGDYRLICKIQDHIVTVVVIKIGHRREVYR